MDKESVKIITDGAVKICKIIVRGWILVRIIRSTPIVVDFGNRGKGHNFKKYVERRSYAKLHFSSRVEAEAVLNSLRERLGEYGTVSVGNLYDAIGIIPEFAMYKYGWKNLDNACVINVDLEYVLNLPPAQPLD